MLVTACSLLPVACTDDGGATTEDGSDDQPDSGDGLGMGACADICGMPDCGSCPSATMVDGGGFMIDATEVSNEQYAAMIDVEFDASVLPAGCEWKSQFVPEDWSDDLDGTLPVVGVDWCDAMVYCAWAGKELCGAVGGGATSLDNAEDAEGDAWFRACSEAGVRVFPYGADYDPSACNGDDAAQDGLWPVGSMPSCEGGVTGLFDMSGNVWEWTNAC
ncbi:MAG: SUMF1/EgtB/PvdO family nonheme iron enzyme, partial [Myxococcales bacterium]|nr:SUMF1/EgtB/PvdO family nonheme iron enzyme [Myxococcales bacterium]